VSAEQIDQSTETLAALKDWDWLRSSPRPPE